MAIRVLNREEVISSVGNRGIAEALVGSYEAALNAVDPYHLVRSRLSLKGDKLVVDSEVIDLREFSELYVIGTGKATYRMAVAVEELLGERISHGVISVPRSQSIDGLKRIKVFRAGHPLPDSGSLEAAREILSLRPGHRCLVLALVSGGGSALLELPEDEITLDDLKVTNEALLRSGASIDEINCIRKAISRVKGGRLLEHFKPCRVVQLTVSDVPGNDLSSIASGPFFPGLCDKERVNEIISKYELLEEVPERVAKAISAYEPAVPEAGNRASYFLLADNALAVRSLGEALKGHGLNLVEEVSLNGDVSSVAEKAASLALRLKDGQALVGGGEANVKVKGSGRGGRSFHLAALLMLKLWGIDGLYGISATTDGMDGNTDAAGCLFSTKKEKDFERLKASVEGYDTYTEFLSMGTVIFTGYTGTNVNDLLAVVKE